MARQLSKEDQDYPMPDNYTGANSEFSIIRSGDGHRPTWGGPSEDARNAFEIDSRDDELGEMNA